MTSQKTGKAPAPMQKLYDLTMVAARKLIYGNNQQDGQRFDLIVKRLEQSRADIGEAIGTTVATILFNVRGGLAKQLQTQVPDPVLFAAGRELVTELIAIAQAKGIMPQGKQTAIEQQAIESGIKAYRVAIAPPKPGQPAQPPQPVAPMQPPAQGA
jgi:hypothetical protein